MLNKIYNKIKEFSTIIIHRHQKPDGDAIGAQIGLKQAILATFQDKHVFVVGDETSRYQFLGIMDEIEDHVYEDALVIVLDTGASFLISDERYKLGKFLIKMDHHIPQGEYGDLAFVDTSFESASGLVAYFIKETGMALSKESATAIFVGMVTDSGRFRFSSTNARTFELASMLMSAGIDLEYIYKQIYLEDLDSVRLRAKLTMKFEVLPSGVAILKNTYQEVLSYKMTPFQVSRGMVGIMGGIKGIPIWANFTEDENGKVLVEIRSSGININQVATKYGGGGHLQASGATIESFEIANELIKDLERLLEEEANA